MYRYKNVMATIGITSIVILILTSSAAVASEFGFDKKFADHTYIGPFNISNNKTKQAKSKLGSDLSDLHTKLEVNIVYQDIQFSLPAETITFDVDMTLVNANSGEDNPIIASVSREGLKIVLRQELPGIHITDNAIDSIATGIERDLQTGITPINVHISDYIGRNEMPDEEVASSEYRIDGISPAFSKVIQALDKSIIRPFGSFSSMELVTSSGVGSISDEEMTLLSSLLYSAVLQTNFQIDERNRSTVLSPDIQPGFEAAINQSLGLDFQFTNPNKTEFTIRAAWSAGAIRLTIEGKPFYYTYEPYVVNIETYKPRTIRQYSASVNDGQVDISEQGKEGVEAVVKRTISIDGNVVETEVISEDFYAPIQRIEIHPLSKSASVSDTANSEESDPSQNGGSSSEIEIDASELEEVESNNFDTDNATGSKELTEEEVVYDKSGLPLSGK
ncbi:MAG TPA: VanW family protein [Sporosarcina sp.]|nr:VanW family protein [Sporosarcina sp.]